MVKGTQDIFIGHVTTVVSKLPSLINWHPVVCALFSDKRSIIFFWIGTCTIFALISANV